MLKKLAVTVAATAAIPIAVAAQGRGRGAGQPVQAIQQIKPGLYLVAGGGANSVIRSTSDGLILVDAKLPAEQNYNDLMTQMRTVTNQPVKYVVVTHHHADHTGNTSRFLDAGAQVIGHENLKKNLTSYQFDPLPASASTTYDKEYGIRLGRVEVQVRHYGRSHTSGDSIVYFPIPMPRSAPPEYSGDVCVS